MPEYDPVNYPKPLLDDLTHAEAGRDSVAGPDPAAWPSNDVLPEPYAGPPTSREFETVNRRPLAHARPLAPVAPPTEPAVQPSSSPPPGHTA